MLVPVPHFRSLLRGQLLLPTWSHGQQLSWSNTLCWLVMLFLLFPESCLFSRARNQFQRHLALFGVSCPVSNTYGFRYMNYAWLDTDSGDELDKFDNVLTMHKVSNRNSALGYSGLSACHRTVCHLGVGIRFMLGLSVAIRYWLGVLRALITSTGQVTLVVFVLPVREVPAGVVAS